MKEILALVDPIAMDSYKGAIDELKVGFINLGFILDGNFASMMFRGPMGVLKEFNESKLEYFDENQALGKMYFFFVTDHLGDMLTELNQYSNLSIHNWQIYDIPAYVLLIYNKVALTSVVNKLRGFNTKEVLKFSYLLREDSLEQSLRLFSKEGEIFKCYPIGGEAYVSRWKNSFYKKYRRV